MNLTRHQLDRFLDQQPNPDEEEWARPKAVAFCPIALFYAQDCDDAIEVYEKHAIVAGRRRILPQWARAFVADVDATDVPWLTPRECRDILRSLEQRWEL